LFVKGGQYGRITNRVQTKVAASGRIRRLEKISGNTLGQNPVHAHKKIFPLIIQTKQGNKKMWTQRRCSKEKKKLMKKKEHGRVQEKKRKNQQIESAKTGPLGKQIQTKETQGKLSRSNLPNAQGVLSQI